MISALLLSPADGGAIATYTVVPRLRADGPSTDAGMAVERSERTLTNEERGKQ